MDSFKISLNHPISSWAVCGVQPLDAGHFIDAAAGPQAAILSGAGKFDWQQGMSDVSQLSPAQRAYEISKIAALGPFSGSKEWERLVSRFSHIVEATAYDQGVTEGRTAAGVIAWWFIMGICAIESRFDPTARNSSSSAAGLGQFTGATWSDFRATDPNVPQSVPLARDEASVTSQLRGVAWLLDARWPRENVSLPNWWSSVSSLSTALDSWNVSDVELRRRYLGALRSAPLTGVPTRIIPALLARFMYGQGRVLQPYWASRSATAAMSEKSRELDVLQTVWRAYAWGKRAAENSQWPAINAPSAGANHWDGHFMISPSGALCLPYP